ncbi:MAG: nicotinate-nucleotide--dimethylbenzimidazole phosphoribosyltransferase [Pseudomonadota bacterium]|nr:nicotinate-nucleotide--dimethylbenzimidazole phosphoribosyltransferase [Pseudomonadota bacterium]
MADMSFDPAERAAVYRAIHTRRDVRSYLPDAVPGDVLARVLDAAHHAPSVGFMQPWNFLLVEDPLLRRNVYDHVRACSIAAGSTYVDTSGAGGPGDRAATYAALKLQGILDAPLNLIVTCDPDRGGNVLGRHTMRETDAYSTCLAVQNLWLAARAEGLGVGWVSILKPEAIRGMFGIPERVLVIAYLTLGWPVELAPEPMLQSVGWRARLPLRELVFRDRWEASATLPSTREPPPSVPAPTAAEQRNAQLTKPPGSLGRLELAALQVATVQRVSYPRWQRKALVLCAGDHGVVEEGVSAYRREVTARMVIQFVAGGAAINAFARQYGIALTIADLGVDHDFRDADGNVATGIVNAKVRRGTRNLAVEDAMTSEECAAAIAAGRRLVPDCDLLAVGEMGIGNSTSAAAMACALLGEPPEAIVGRGTGIGAETWSRKVDAVRRGVARGGDVLCALGGYEIAGLVGVIDEAALRGIPVLLDGFITGVAALEAVRRRPAVQEALLAGHRSAEAGHARVLDALGLVPLLDLGMRLGEGSGAALAIGLVEAACRTLSEMRTFDEAGIEDAVAPGGRA